LDGVLGNLQWFEKRIHPDLKAAALLFQWQLKPLEPVDPAFFYKDCDPFRGFRQDVRRPNLFEKMVRAWRTTASLVVLSLMIASLSPAKHNAYMD
jgi:hypothetical protein